MNIIAEHTAGTSQIFITSEMGRKGRQVFTVNIAHTPKNYITWSVHYTETEARKSANVAWTRFSGRETMICA